MIRPILLHSNRMTKFLKVKLKFKINWKNKMKQRFSLTIYLNLGNISKKGMLNWKKRKRTPSVRTLKFLTFKRKRSPIPIGVGNQRLTVLMTKRDAKKKEIWQRLSTQLLDGDNSTTECKCPKSLDQWLLRLCSIIWRTQQVSSVSARRALTIIYCSLDMAENLGSTLIAIKKAK